MECAVHQQTVLGLLVLVGLSAGLLGSLAALITPRPLRREQRHRYWLVATVGFLVAGALGILSIGLVFVMAAGATGMAAARAAADRDEPGA